MVKLLAPMLIIIAERDELLARRARALAERKRA